MAVMLFKGEMKQLVFFLKKTLSHVFVASVVVVVVLFGFFFFNNFSTFFFGLRKIIAIFSKKYKTSIVEC